MKTHPTKNLSDISTNICALLAPISDELPGGVDLSFSQEIEILREMRREDDPALDQGDWVTGFKTADWPGLASACEAILINKSKDLQLLAWLVEAWARLYGFAGLSTGLELACEMLTRFWDEMHPLPDDDNIDRRIGNLKWLASQITQVVPVTPLVVVNTEIFTLLDVIDARRQKPPNISDVNGPLCSPEPRASRSGLDLASICRAITEAGSHAAHRRRSGVEEVKSLLTQLQTIVDERLGQDAPSLHAAREALVSVLDELTKLERECHLTEVSSTNRLLSDEPTDTGLAVTELPKDTIAVAAEVMTRAHALTQLRAVAGFFRATEPHSPVAYLAEKAVRWSDMPLHEWLRVVVKDEGSLIYLDEILGVGSRPMP